MREASEDPDLIEYLEEIGSSLALPDILGLLNYQVRLFEQCQMHKQPEFVLNLRASALGAPALLLADLAIQVRRGKNFWGVGRFFFWKTAATQKSKVENRSED